MSPAAIDRGVAAPLASARRARSGFPVALVLGLLAVALVVAAVPLSALAHELALSWLVQPLLMIPFAGVGFLVASRQRQNPIGWLLLALALSAAIGADAGFYAVRAYRVDHQGLPLSRLAVALTQGWISLLVLLPLPIVFFPDGRLPSPRWRWTLRAYGAIVAVLVGAIGYEDSGVFTDRRIVVDSSGELARLGGSPSGAFGVLWRIIVVVYVTIVVAWVVRQIVAYRHSTGDQRAQLKWLLSGGVVSLLGIVTSIVLGSSHGAVFKVISDAGFVSLAALPLSIGVGILRYKLYEIDRLVSRTLAYALLTALLAGVFVGLVTLLTDVLPFSSPVAVAASTLAAAALFNRLRRRTQRLIDRRFNRARYDFEATVRGFSGRLRDALDLESISNELLRVVEQTIAPTHASLWMKPSAPKIPTPEQPVQN
jgi:hypothetical protein